MVSMVFSAYYIRQLRWYISPNPYLCGRNYLVSVGFQCVMFHCCCVNLCGDFMSKITGHGWLNTMLFIDSYIDCLMLIYRGVYSIVVAFVPCNPNVHCSNLGGTD